MRQLFMAVCMLLTINLLQAQGDSIPQTKILVGNETWLVASGKSNFRLITSNDSIALRCIRYIAGRTTQFTIKQKKDTRSGGIYWERTLYFRNEDYGWVVSFINKKFRL